MPASLDEGTLQISNRCKLLHLSPRLPEPLPLPRLRSAYRRLVCMRNGSMWTQVPIRTNRATALQDYVSSSAPGGGCSYSTMGGLPNEAQSSSYRTTIRCGGSSHAEHLTWCGCGRIVDPKRGKVLSSVQNPCPQSMSHNHRCLGVCDRQRCRTAARDARVSTALSMQRSS